jgi:hypothetical protein
MCLYTLDADCKLLSLYNAYTVHSGCDVYSARMTNTRTTMITTTNRGYRGRNRACAIRASVTRWMAAVADEEAADYVADFKARERKQKNKFALIGSGIPDDDDDSSFSLDMRDFQ